MERDVTCFFTGHRFIPKNEYPYVVRKTERVISRLFERGFRDFICGGAIGFDTDAANAVLRLRRDIPIRLHIMAPCADQDARFSPCQKTEYAHILECADTVKILAPRYFNGCMHARNRAMADASSVCIAYCIKDSGGTAYTLSYAEKTGLEIIRI